MAARRVTSMFPDIMRAILWTNGMVMVFDHAGKQIPDLQGHYGEKIDQILPRMGKEPMYLCDWPSQTPLAVFYPQMRREE
jgi:hypothetical protein